MLRWLCGTLLLDSGGFKSGSVSLRLGSGVSKIDCGTIRLHGVSIKIGSVKFGMEENRAGEG